jgi:hypothetical protein
MFRFKAPSAVGYPEAIKQARLINGSRKELRAATEGQMLEFANASALGRALDEQIGSQVTSVAVHPRRQRALA